jgi:hypothetical protein
MNRIRAEIAIAPPMTARRGRPGRLARRRIEGYTSSRRARSHGGPLTVGADERVELTVGRRPEPVEDGWAPAGGVGGSGGSEAVERGLTRPARSSSAPDAAAPPADADHAAADRVGA